MATISYLAEAMSLARYAQMLGYQETAFFGLNRPGDAQFECRTIWTLFQREMVRRALDEAQAMLERELRYPLATAAIEEDAQVYRHMTGTRYGYLLYAGRASWTYLGEYDLDWSADPAVTEAIVTSYPERLIVTPTAEFADFIAIEDYAIGPAGVVLSIPWARLVAPAYWDNPGEGWHYADYLTWGLMTVHVWEWTLDATQGVELQRWQTATQAAASDYGTLVIQLADVGQVGIIPPDVCGRWDAMRLNYVAGHAPAGYESALIRLAHTLMPEEPCGCDVVKAMWSRDRKTTEVFTRERLNCPFGLADGAWFAWRWAQANALRRFSVL